MSSRPIVTTSSLSATSRKRTSTFSEPLPRKKTSRTMLRRTDSFLSLSDFSDESHLEGASFLHMSSSSHDAPSYHTFLHYKEQRARLGRKRAEFTIAPFRPQVPFSKHAVCVPPTPPSPKPAAPNVRTSSPLSPKQKLLPPRASFPRSKPEPDLYRAALKGQMRSSPEGEKILRMGPRLAIAILSATRELERIVSSCEDDDVIMGDDTAQSAGWGFGRDGMWAVPCGA